VLLAASGGLSTTGPDIPDQTSARSVSAQQAVLGLFSDDKAAQLRPELTPGGRAFQTMEQGPSLIWQLDSTAGYREAEQPQQVAELSLAAAPALCPQAVATAGVATCGLGMEWTAVTAAVVVPPNAGTDLTAEQTCQASPHLSGSPFATAAQALPHAAEAEGPQPATLLHFYPLVVPLWRSSSASRTPCEAHGSCGSADFRALMGQLPSSLHRSASAAECQEALRKLGHWPAPVDEHTPRFDVHSGILSHALLRRDVDSVSGCAEPGAACSALGTGRRCAGIPRLERERSVSAAPSSPAVRFRRDALASSPAKRSRRTVGAGRNSGGGGAIMALAVGDRSVVTPAPPPSTAPKGVLKRGMAESAVLDGSGVRQGVDLPSLPPRPVMAASNPPQHSCILGPAALTACHVAGAPGPLESDSGSLADDSAPRCQLTHPKLTVVPASPFATSVLCRPLSPVCSASPTTASSAARHGLAAHQLQQRLQCTGGVLGGAGGSLRPPTTSPSPTSGTAAASTAAAALGGLRTLRRRLSNSVLPLPLRAATGVGGAPGPQGHAADTSDRLACATAAAPGGQQVLWLPMAQTELECGAVPSVPEQPDVGHAWLLPRIPASAPKSSAAPDAGAAVPQPGRHRHVVYQPTTSANVHNSQPPQPGAVAHLVIEASQGLAVPADVTANVEGEGNAAAADMRVAMDAGGSSSSSSMCPSELTLARTCSVLGSGMYSCALSSSVDAVGTGGAAALMAASGASGAGLNPCSALTLPPTSLTFSFHVPGTGTDGGDRGLQEYLPPPTPHVAPVGWISGGEAAPLPALVEEGQSQGQACTYFGACPMTPTGEKLPVAEQQLQGQEAASPVAVQATMPHALCATQKPIPRHGSDSCLGGPRGDAVQHLAVSQRLQHHHSDGVTTYQAHRQVSSLNLAARPSWGTMGSRPLILDGRPPRPPQLQACNPTWQPPKGTLQPSAVPEEHTGVGKLAALAAPPGTLVGHPATAQQQRRSASPSPSNDPSIRSMAGHNSNVSGDSSLTVAALDGVCSADLGASQASKPPAVHVPQQLVINCPSESHAVLSHAPSALLPSPFRQVASSLVLGDNSSSGGVRGEVLDHAKAAQAVTGAVHGEDVLSESPPHVPGATLMDWISQGAAVAERTAMAAARPPPLMVGESEDNALSAGLAVSARLRVVWQGSCPTSTRVNFVLVHSK
jgi:hypothetical protein